MGNGELISLTPSGPVRERVGDQAEGARNPLQAKQQGADFAWGFAPTS